MRGMVRVGETGAGSFFPCAGARQGRERALGRRRATGGACPLGPSRSWRAAGARAEPLGPRRPQQRPGRTRSEGRAPPLASLPAPGTEAGRGGVTDA